MNSNSQQAQGGAQNEIVPSSQGTEGIPQKRTKKSQKEKGKNDHKKMDDREAVERMKGLLSLARSNKAKFTDQSNQDLRLHFAHKMKVVYSEQQKLAHGIIFNQNSMCFTSYNERGVNVWHPETAETLFKISFEVSVGGNLTQGGSISENANRQIQCICYSPKNFLYFAVTRNFKLLVFNEYLNIVADLPFKCGQITQVVFVDENHQLIAAGRKGIFLYQLNIQYTYPPRQAILLNPKGDSVKVAIEPFKEIRSDFMQFRGGGEWFKGLSLDLSGGQLCAWETTSVHLYQFHPSMAASVNTADPTVLGGVTSKQDYITAVMLFPQFNYFVVGTQLGNLKVYKWDRHKKTKQQMHVFKSHTRQITSLKRVVTSEEKKKEGANQKQQTTFVSASLDGTIRVLCLEQFVELYVFNIEENGEQQTGGDQGNNNNMAGRIITDIHLIDDTNFAVFSKGHQSLIEVGQISHLASSYFITESGGEKTTNSRKQAKKTADEQAQQAGQEEDPVDAARSIKISKAFHSMNKMAMNETKALLGTFDNNSIIILDPLTAKVKATIYPPPTPTNIQLVLYCMAIRRVIILLESGTLCVYKFHDRDTGTLERLQFSKQLRDLEGKSLTQDITTMTNGTILPPQTDCEIFSDLVGIVAKANQEKNSKNSQQLKELKRSNNEYLRTDIGTAYEEPASSSSSETSSLADQSDYSAAQSAAAADDEDAELEQNSQKSGQIVDQAHEIEETNRRKQLALVRDNFLILGLSKGSVIFVKVDQLDVIFARFSVHRQRIEHIAELGDKRGLASICAENILNIWGFGADGKSQVWRSINTCRPLKSLYAFSHPSKLLIGFPSGESIFLKWEHTNRNFSIIKADQQSEHEETVLSIDEHKKMRLLVSCDQGGLIKIWNFKRDLIREIQFTEPVTSVCFLNENADLLVGHLGKVSKILAKDYLPCDEETYQIRGQAQEEAILAEIVQPMPDNFFEKLKSDLEADLSPRALAARQAQNRGAKSLFDCEEESQLEEPKYGMPMQKFKALLHAKNQKENKRVNKKLGDKKASTGAGKQKELRKNESQQKEIVSQTLRQALLDAVKEQSRITVPKIYRAEDDPKNAPTEFISKRPPRGQALLKNSKTVKSIGKFVDMDQNSRDRNNGAPHASSDTLTTNQQTTDSRFGDRSKKKNRVRPGTIKALPNNLGKVVNGRVIQSAKQRGGGGATRQQMTLDRIADNIKYFNRPDGVKNQGDINLFGEALDQMSVFSEQILSYNQNTNWHHPGHQSSSFGLGTMNSHRPPLSTTNGHRQSYNYRQTSPSKNSVYMMATAAGEGSQISQRQLLLQNSGANEGGGGSARKSDHLKEKVSNFVASSSGRKPTMPSQQNVAGENNSTSNVEETKMDTNTENGGRKGGQLISLFGGSTDGGGGGLTSSHRKIVHGGYHLKSQAANLNVIPQDERENGVKMTKFRQQKRKALASANIYQQRRGVSGNATNHRIEYENIVINNDGDENQGNNVEGVNQMKNRDKQNDESRSQAQISAEIPAFFKMSSSIAANSTKMKRPFSRPTGAVSAKAANFGLAGIQSQNYRNNRQSQNFMNSYLRNNATVAFGSDSTATMMAGGQFGAKLSKNQAHALKGSQKDGLMSMGSGVLTQSNSSHLAKGFPVRRPKQSAIVRGAPENMLSPFNPTKQTGPSISKTQLLHQNYSNINRISSMQMQNMATGGGGLQKQHIMQEAMRVQEQSQQKAAQNGNVNRSSQGGGLHSIISPSRPPIMGGIVSKGTPNRRMHLLQSQHDITKAQTTTTHHLVNINAQRVASDSEQIQSNEEQIESDKYKKIVVGPPAPKDAHKSSNLGKTEEQTTALASAIDFDKNTGVLVEGGQNAAVLSSSLTKDEEIVDGQEIIAD